MKIVCVLYDGGKAAQEEPRLLGTTENSLGIADWLKQNGHEYVVTSDKEGPNSKFAKEIVDADIYIGTPFHPGYLTRELIATAKKLKLCITAGVGSDHVDLNACNERKISVCEVSGSNVVAVAEHVMMTILVLLRNFVPAHEQVMSGGWNVADICRFSFDLENKVVGTIGAGRIGFRVLQRLKPFDCKELLYFDYAPLPEHAAKEVGVRRVESLEEMVAQCDVITVNCPLHEKTKGLVNKALISKMKKGAILVNTARGAICVAEDVAEALKTGQLGGYGGDVWNVQPAPKDHPWRSCKNHLGGGNAMTAHISGSSLDSQKRYAEGTRKILENFMTGKPQDPANVIVENGEYATKAYGQRAAERKK